MGIIERSSDMQGRQIVGMPLSAENALHELVKSAAPKMQTPKKPARLKLRLQSFTANVLIMLTIFLDSHG
jgi:hypothetical protein